MLDAPTAPLHTSTSLAAILTPIPPERLAILTNPDTDPARIFPTYATKNHPPVMTSPVMSVEALEAALLAHVRDGVCARETIRAVFHPFADDAFIEVEPGKGQQRPSYAFHIDSLGIIADRASVRTIAEGLHATALRLSAYAVGNRAPVGSPSFTLESQRHHRSLTITSADLRSVRHAFVAATGTNPSSIRVPLPTTIHDVVEHVRAARALFAAKALGQDEARTTALAVIRAIHDLRTATTVLLRQCESRRYRRNTITLQPSNHAITITDGMEMTTSHEKLQAAQKYRELHTTLSAVLANHPVLRALPESCVITLNGETHYLDVEIIDTHKPSYTDNSRIPSSLLEYDSLQALAEQLTAMGQQDATTPDANWLMVLEGRTRTAHTWELSGPTFTDALVAKLCERDTRSSAMLIDLLIDLLSHSRGDEAPNVQVWRVV